MSQSLPDPYTILGVARDATADQIKAAYRTLAKKHHPDLNPGDVTAVDRFKDISAAYELLSDADKRTRFDRGEIDASGQEQAPRGFYRDFAEGPQAGAYQQGFGGGAGLDEDLLAELFGRMAGGGPGGRGGMKRRGEDVSYSLRADFLDAAVGGKKRLTLPDGRVLDVAIPPGSRDRQTLRLKGQGAPGLNGGPDGDAYIELHLQPHAFFTRKDQDIHLELPVTLTEAVLGAKVAVPTVSGPVMVTIPPRSNSGTMLRLKGKGIADRTGGPAGDQYVKLRLVLPDGGDEALARFLEGWEGKDYDVRRKVGMEP